MGASRHRILLGVTGSIAATKSPEIVRVLVGKGYDVRCVLTSSAERFVSPLVLSTFSKKQALSDVFAPEAYRMYHLEASDEAHLMLIAPVTATVLGRCAYGLAEDLVTLAYISTKAPVIMAPAMHNTMWEHPATQENVRLLKSRGVTFVGPSKGALADNTEGEGRMAEPAAIVRAVEKVLKKKPS